MNKKILIIIKSHDKKYANYHNEMYEKIEELSKNYLSNKKEEIDFIYVKANPNLNMNYLYEKENNIFWVKVKEDYWDSLKIKVLQSLKYFLYLENINYDYVFITNLSTFINVDKLLEECYDLNQQECGAKIGTYTFNDIFYEFPSGAGSIYSTVLMKQILEYEKTIDHSKYPTTDDIFFGKLLLELKIKIKPIARNNIEHLHEYENILSNKYNSFSSHVRIKVNTSRDIEPKIHNTLSSIIYGHN